MYEFIASLQGEVKILSCTPVVQQHGEICWLSGKEVVSGMHRGFTALLYVFLNWSRSYICMTSQAARVLIGQTVEQSGEAGAG